MGTINETAVDDRAWVRTAVQTLARESARTADTHLLYARIPGFAGIDFYFKDEASHPSGSLKHRLARSLFLYALCNGRLSRGQTVIDRSSGSTAISEAWFARLLGMSFEAVMPRDTAQEKVDAIRALGGSPVLVATPEEGTAAISRRVAEGACHLDQFTLAERATDWRGNNNIAESIIMQMAAEPHPSPTWIVCGVGTGGTAATIGRYLRYRGLFTRLCVAEPRGGAFAVGWATRDPHAIARQPTLIEGIGLPKAEPGFVYEVVDRVVEVDDTTSIAAMEALARLLGSRYGGSSGTNFAACIRLARQMRDRGQVGSIVALLGDRGDRYAQTLYDPAWLATQRIDVQMGRRSFETGLDCTAEQTMPKATGRPGGVEQAMPSG